MCLPPIVTTCGKSQRLEAVVVSVGVSKTLEVFLDNNLRHFDNTIVATTSYDTDTQNLCLRYNVKCIVTDAFHRNGQKFDRGIVRHICLKELQYKEFVLFIDSDVILHAHFRKYLSSLKLNVDCLYGADRIIVTKEVHLELIKTGNLCGPIMNDWGFGFFQLFNMDSKYLKGKQIITPSTQDRSEPLFDDFLFREQFGGPHRYVDGIWNWDLKAQQRLSMWCYHLGEPGKNSRPVIEALTAKAK